MIELLRKFDYKGGAFWRFVAVTEVIIVKHLPQKRSGTNISTVVASTGKKKPLTGPMFSTTLRTYIIACTSSLNRVPGNFETFVHFENADD